MTDQIPATSGGLPTLSGLSSRLVACLTSLDDDASVYEIADSPSLVAEARVHLPALRNRAMLPATQEQIAAIIRNRFELFPQPDRELEQWQAWWADYFTALAGRPAAAIEAGMVAWVALRDSEYLPKPGRLLELTKAAITPAARAWSIADRASRMEDERRYGRRPEDVRGRLGPETPEDRASVREMAAETVELLRGVGKMPRAPLTFEREPVSPLYAKLMNDALAVSRSAAPTQEQRVSATLDENTQGRLAEGRAITPRMVEMRRAMGLETAPS